MTQFIRTNKNPVNTGNDKSNPVQIGRRGNLKKGKHKLDRKLLSVTILELFRMFGYITHHS